MATPEQGQMGPDSILTLKSSWNSPGPVAGKLARDDSGAVVFDGELRSAAGANEQTFRRITYSEFRADRLSLLRVPHNVPGLSGEEINNLLQLGERYGRPEEMELEEFVVLLDWGNAILLFADQPEEDIKGSVTNWNQQALPQIRTYLRPYYAITLIDIDHIRNALLEKNKVPKPAVENPTDNTSAIEVTEKPEKISLKARIPDTILRRAYVMAANYLKISRSATPEEKAQLANKLLEEALTGYNLQALKSKGVFTDEDLTNPDLAEVLNLIK